MKQQILLFFLLLNVITSEAQLLNQRKKWEFEKWPQMFKDRAFCLCLIEGYQDSVIRKFILTLDKSYYDPIAISIFDTTLLPVITNEVARINAKEKKSYKAMHEGAAGRRVFSHCMDFYKSARLNSLLRKTKPQWQKIKDIDEVIYRNMPAF